MCTTVALLAQKRKKKTLFTLRAALHCAVTSLCVSVAMFYVPSFPCLCPVVMITTIHMYCTILVQQCTDGDLAVRARMVRLPSRIALQLHSSARLRARVARTTLIRRS